MHFFLCFRGLHGVAFAPCHESRYIDYEVYRYSTDTFSFRRKLGGRCHRSFSPRLTSSICCTALSSMRLCPFLPCCVFFVHSLNLLYPITGTFFFAIPLHKVRLVSLAIAASILTSIIARTSSDLLKLPSRASKAVADPSR